MWTRGDGYEALSLFRAALAVPGGVLAIQAAPYGPAGSASIGGEITDPSGRGTPEVTITLLRAPDVVALFQRYRRSEAGASIITSFLAWRNPQIPPLQRITLRRY